MSQSEHLLDSPARVTRQLLIDLGLCSVSGDWPVAVANEPDSPDERVTVYDSPEGRDDGRSMIDGELWSHPAVTVRVRAGRDEAGRPKAEAIRQALSAVRQRQVNVGANPYVVQCFARIGQVVSLGTGPTGKRVLFNVNASLSVWRIA